MNHDDTTNRKPCELVDDYLDGDLPTGEVVRLKQHIEQCEGCRNAIEEQQWIDGFLRSPEAVEAEKTPADVLQKVAAGMYAARRRRILRRSLVGAAAAAVIGAIAFWQLAAERTPQRIAAPGSAGGSTYQSDIKLAATPRQSRGLKKDVQVHELAAASFIPSNDAIAVPVASDDDEVSIVQLYPTTTTERRWRRELSLNAGLAGQDGG
jgi:predicted anti-sigma-YlaC factor YlaD